MGKLEDKRKRAETANRFIEIISKHGRRFFHCEGRVSRLEVDNRGRVWLVDKYTQKRIYTHYAYNWRYFSDGGTLRDLVIALREFICGRAALPLNHLGPWPKCVCGGDLWGYGESSAKVRKECRALAGIEA